MGREPSLPFRAVPRTATTSGEVLHRMNLEAARSGSPRFVPAEEALGAIRSTARPSPRRIVGWIQHPDEVVALAVAERHLSKPLWSSRWDAALGPLLLDRAWRDARAEGVLWTPLLDLASLLVDLEASGALAPPPELLVFLEDAASQGEEDALQELLRFRSPLLVQEVARHLRRPSRETVMQLLERPGAALGLAQNPGLGPAEQSLVAHWARDRVLGTIKGARSRSLSVTWARALGPALVLHGLGSCGWSPPPALAEELQAFLALRRKASHTSRRSRSHREQNLYVALALSALGRERGIREVDDVVAIHHFPLHALGIAWLGKQGLLSRRLRLWILRNSGKIHDIKLALRPGEGLTEKEVMILLQRSLPHQPRDRDALLLTLDDQAHRDVEELLGDEPVVKLLKELAQTDRGGDAVFRQACRRILVGDWARKEMASKKTPDHALDLLQHLAREEEDLLGLDPAWFPEGIARKRLMGHPLAGLRLWKEALGWADDGEWRRAVAGVSRARCHPEVRPALLAADDPEVHLQLLKDGRPRECGALLARLIPTHPHAVVEILGQAPPGALRGVDPVLLAPLLASDDPHLRAAAFVILGRVGGPEPPPRERLCHTPQPGTSLRWRS